MKIKTNYNWIEELTETIIKEYPSWYRESKIIENNGDGLGYKYLKQQIQNTISGKWLAYETKEMMECLHENRDKR